jgi:predicted SnoaL-like aldol condensation-catalyzing enzyme
MKTAAQLLDDFLLRFRTPEEAAALFAEDGALELPYLADLGMPVRCVGRKEIAGLLTRMLELVPDWMFSDREIVIDTPDKVMAEYKVDALTAGTQRPFRQHFFGYAISANGQIKLLRGALNIVATARTFFPNGLADLLPAPTIEEQNKTLVLDALDTLFNKNDFNRAKKLWSDRYVQHSRHVPAEREGLFGLVRSMGDIRFEYDMAIAKDDFVWVHSRYTTSSSPAALIAVDIFRIKGGKIIEHWDVLQDEATRSESAGGHPMFGDTFPNAR